MTLFSIEDKTLEERRNENDAIRDKVLSQLSAIEGQIEAIKEGLNDYKII